MNGWIEFALERYNYWIVIVLMMTGLYIVFARGNLVKKIVGLNVFQTSVFIFYITIGNISGGTAPIFINGGGHGDDDHGGGDHGDDSHGAEAAGGDEHGAPAHGDAAAEDGLHAKIENTFEGLKPNDLKAATDALGPAEEAIDPPSLHDAPNNVIAADADKIANDALAGLEKPAAGGVEITVDGAPGAEAAHGVDGAAQTLGEVVYTNPLPHVLILTAIVVGVATTAVGLALAVRIREAYGTIEEDELDAIDHVAEFGEAAAASGGTS